MNGIKLGWRDNFGSLQSMVGHDFTVLAAAGNMEIPMARVDFADSAIGKSSAATINSLFTASYSENREIIIPLYLNGREIAVATYEDLKKLGKQRGE